jgi:hypothetical protein
MLFYLIHDNDILWRISKRSISLSHIKMSTFIKEVLTILIDKLKSQAKHVIHLSVSMTTTQKLY